MMNLRNAMVVVMTLAASQALAQSAMDAEKAERCATRLSIAITGKAPTAALIGKAAPQDDVDALLATADFQERFSRFINASFNGDPGLTNAEDASYHLTKYVLTNNLKWEDMFLGQYKVDVDPAATANVIVTSDANGLGYFRSMPWLKRYAGNEMSGIKLSTAYRIMQNTIGLKLIPSTNAPGADLSANGRQSAGCRACHFDGWFAIDKVASVLSRRTGTPTNITFGPPPAAPQEILGGMIINDDKELVTALVKSEAFQFRACRLAFEFLYGRPEVTCEGPVFDRCMDAFKAGGTITSALATVAKDQTYCQ
jgi:hypothetical protein